MSFIAVTTAAIVQDNNRESPQPMCHRPMMLRLPTSVQCEIAQVHLDGSDRVYFHVMMPHSRVRQVSPQSHQERTWEGSWLQTVSVHLPWDLTQKQKHHFILCVNPCDLNIPVQKNLIQKYSTRDLIETVPLGHKHSQGRNSLRSRRQLLSRVNRTFEPWL